MNKLLQLLNQKENRWITGISLVFILANALAVYYGFTLFAYLPVTLFILAVAVFHMDKLYWLVLFCVPLSIDLQRYVPSTPVNMFLPTEPLLAAFLILFLLKMLQGKWLDRGILLHPVTLIILIYVGWLTLTIFTSELPLVSLKSVLTKYWFLVSFYFLAIYQFKQSDNIKKYLWLYTASFIIVVIYTTIRHGIIGFDDLQASHHSCKPFYNDHTAYGAAVSMIIPAVFGLLVLTKDKLSFKFMLGLGALFLLILALYLSYSRAAWLTVIIGVCYSIALMWKIKLRTLLLGIGVVFALFWVFRVEIIMSLEKNTQDSKGGNFAKHITSATNISTDASNVERINRWKSALKLYHERPVFGWGPGTYQFVYAPYQLSYDRTIISTNFGTIGTAHSEYLLALSEAGLPGAVFFTLILMVTLYTAQRLYFKAQSRKVRVMVLFLITGLITYYLHAFLNNFLDTDKLSALFWGFTAALVALDLYHRNNDTLDLGSKAENKTE